MEISDFISRTKSLQPGVDTHLIERAYRFSQMAHGGQVRASGDPYLEHCVQVALILAEHRLDSTTIAAGLLHDVLEDTNVISSQLSQEFGEEIADLVNGVSKISELRFHSREEQQAEYFRKLLLFMAKDIRVILIKFADRLHNMRTLSHLERERQSRIALETREVYVPLAHRLGMARIKGELEDLALKSLDSNAYWDLVDRIALKREERETYLEEIKRPLVLALQRERIQAEIVGRAKHFASIYRKMRSRHLPLEKIYDLMAIRVITESERDCYHVLGMIHSMWPPVQDRFKDYIAIPKSNGYQSLHTTVIGPGRRMVEIQIRTRQMHHMAEFGIAAHWLYEEGRRKVDRVDEHLGWLRQVLDWQQDLQDPHEFMELLKIDLFRDEIFVFTPKGDLKRLPLGATPIDFAFAVHSEIGFHCAGARVNERLVPLGTELKSGDTVEIISSPHQKPSRDWLKVVRSSRAKSKLRRWFRQEQHIHSLTLGREILDRYLRKRRRKLDLEGEDMADVAQRLGYTDVEHLMVALGQGDLSPNQLMSRLFPSEEVLRASEAKRLIQRVRIPRGVKVQGMTNMMIRFAQCCHPLPGDRIIGFITRGRGISIHRVDCLNAIALMEDIERTIFVEWDVERGESFLVKIEVLLQDRRGILSEVTKALADTGINIKGADVGERRGVGRAGFLMEVRNLHHLHQAIRSVEQVKGVLEVKRGGGDVLREEGEYEGGLDEAKKSLDKRSKLC